MYEEKERKEEEEKHAQKRNWDVGREGMKK